jgi:Peptidase M15
LRAPANRPLTAGRRGGHPTRGPVARLEALRHKLGDHPLVVTSGFRSIACNQRVGGASNSQHLYGTAADVIGSGGVSLCAIALTARTAGFSCGIPTSGAAAAAESQDGPSALRERRRSAAEPLGLVHRRVRGVDELGRAAPQQLLLGPAQQL